MTTPSEDEILALARKAQEVAPGAWEKDSIRTDGEYGTGDETHSGFDAFQMFAGDKVLFDSANSNASVIETEIDEDLFVHAWDETARKVFAYIAAANPAAIIALIERHRAEVEELRAEADRWAKRAGQYAAEVERLTRELEFEREQTRIVAKMFDDMKALKLSAESALAAANARINKLVIECGAYDDMLADERKRVGVLEAALTKMAYDYVPAKDHHVVLRAALAEEIDNG